MSDRIDSTTSPRVSLRRGAGNGRPTGHATGQATGQAAGQPAGPSVGELVAAASRDLSTLVRDEIELAKLELKADVRFAGKGIAMFAVAGVLALFALVMLLIALAEGLVTAGLWRWLSYLVVGVVILLVCAVLGLVGKRAVSRVKAPERTIATTKDTVAWAKHPTRP